MSTPVEPMVMQFQPMVEFWHKSRCPECSTANWTYHSHSQRSEPIRDPEICKCWDCGRRYWMMDDSTVNDIYPSELYEEYLEAGESLMDVCGADTDNGRKAPDYLTA